MILMFILFLVSLSLLVWEWRVLHAEPPEILTVPPEVPDYAWGYWNGKSDAEAGIGGVKSYDAECDRDYWDGYTMGWRVGCRVRERKS